MLAKAPSARHKIVPKFFALSAPGTTTPSRSIARTIEPRLSGRPPLSKTRRAYQRLDLRLNFLTAHSMGDERHTVTRVSDHPRRTRVCRFLSGAASACVGKGIGAVITAARHPPRGSLPRSDERTVRESRSSPRRSGGLPLRTQPPSEREHIDGSATEIHHGGFAVCAAHPSKGLDGARRRSRAHAQTAIARADKEHETLKATGRLRFKSSFSLVNDALKTRCGALGNGSMTSPMCRSVTPPHR